MSRATGRPCLVITSPSGPRSSSSPRHCSLNFAAPMVVVDFMKIANMVVICDWQHIMTILIYLVKVRPGERRTMSKLKARTTVAARYPSVLKAEVLMHYNGSSASLGDCDCFASLLDAMGEGFPTHGRDTALGDKVDKL